MGLTPGSHHHPSRLEQDPAYLEAYAKYERKLLKRASTAPDDPDSDKDEEEEDQDEDEKGVRQMARALTSHHKTERWAKEIASCDGNDPNKLMVWLHAIGAAPDPLVIAEATAKGPLLKFLLRKERTEEKWTWTKCAKAIKETFIGESYKLLQEDALRSLTQRPSESVRAFTEEFEQTMVDAYGKGPRDEPSIIRDYLSALNDRSLAKTVYKRNPPTFEIAKLMVLKEEELNRSLRPQVKAKVAAATPISSPAIDALTRATEALVQGQHDAEKRQAELAGQIAALVKVQADKGLKPQNQGQQKGQGQGRGQTQRSQQPKAGSCYRCGSPSHWANECRDRPTNEARPYNWQNNQNTNQPQCFRCKKFGHIARICQAAPPSKPCLCGGMHWLYDCPQKPNRPSQSTQSPLRPQNTQPSSQNRPN